MKTAIDEFRKLQEMVPQDIALEIDMEMAISSRIYDLMTARGLTKKEFAAALGKRPSEVTKWLSGQHNFTIKTIAMLSAFFGETIWGGKQ